METTLTVKSCSISPCLSELRWPQTPALAAWGALA